MKATALAWYVIWKGAGKEKSTHQRFGQYVINNDERFQNVRDPKLFYEKDSKEALRILQESWKGLEMDEPSEVPPIPVEVAQVPAAINEIPQTPTQVFFD
jgi:hypothetical protein